MRRYFGSVSDGGSLLALFVDRRYRGENRNIYIREIERVVRIKISVFLYFFRFVI